ncbi:MAG: LacI family DNA-binding transcriptional regulator [Anaerolineae bacterium]|nr:LacI family DNA-binding transcriptional regulator [Anaerolineae bacterium]
MATLKDVAELANVPMSTAYQVLSGSGDVDKETYTRVTQSAETLNYQLNITIRDVAAYAEVSVTTVSYVINNNPLTKPATRQRVRNAIRELGYHPNTTARNLKTNETRLIGYAWHVAEDPVRRNPLLDLFLYELAEYAEAQGYHILTFTQPNQSGIKPYEDLINTNRVDGFVLSDVTYGDVRVKYLLDKQVPFVTYGKANGEGNFPYVDVDGKRGIQLAIEHLILKGHERIGLISWPEGFRIGDLRTQGYIEAMQMANLPIRENWIAHSPNTMQQAIDATERILSRKPRPTAIVCANDVMAFGAKRYIESLGLEIGTDISLTGYDDTPVAELIDLTSIAQPIALIANRVVDLLLAEISHQRPADHHIVLEPSLVVRESSARPRKTK